MISFLKKAVVFTFRFIINSLLIILVKLRGFDSKFPTYCPNFFNKRELLLWQLKVLYPLLNKDINFRNQISDQTPIEICIPVSIKDIESLEKVVLGARANIKHPIQQIYIIAAPEKAIVDVCEKLGVTFIDEQTVLGYNKSRITYAVNGQDRSGWLFQQLLKLAADGIAKTENFLILDADTIFVKPKIFLYKNKVILDQSTERHEPYHVAYKKIFNKESTSLLSFITHYMLFNKVFLNNMKADIEAIHKKPWDQVILENVDYNNEAGFSEYELYGNYLLSTVPEKIKKEYWFNKNSLNDSNTSYIKSVSLHSYL